MKKSKYPQVPAPGTEPVAPPPKGRPGRPGRPPKHGPKGEKPKKKKKRHTFLWIIVLVLLIGILVGLLIDRGLIFPGGQGWIGGLIGQTEKGGKSDTPIDIVNTTVTPVPSPVATQPVKDDAAKVYLVIKNSTILMNDVEVTAEQLIAQLSTPTYSNSKIYLIDEYATKGVYENVQTILNNLGRSYTVGNDE